MTHVINDNNKITIPVNKNLSIMDLALKKFPILVWIPLYTWSAFLQDSLAGLTVGLTAIPQGIAYAVLAGLPPQKLPGKRTGKASEKLMWIFSLGRNAVIVVTGIILVYVFSTYDMHPFIITGNITEGLPTIALPPFSIISNNRTYNFFEMTYELGESIVTIPFIAILESIAITKIFAKGRAVDTNQEMLALGLSNIFGSFVKSMPVTGSFTRTAINHTSGVQTPMGGIVTGTLVLLACGLLTSTFEFIPKSTLAAIIIVAMYNMLEVHILLILWRTKKVDLIPLFVTIVCCVVISLQYGIVIGVITNLILLLYYVARPGLAIEVKDIDGMAVLFVTPKQSLNFPAAEYFRETVMEWCNKTPGAIPVIIDGKYIHRIDATVAKNFRLLQKDLNCILTSCIILTLSALNCQHDVVYYY